MPSTSRLRWFYVAADYESVHLRKREKKHLWERTVFVFRATQKTAVQTALQVAKEHEHEYKNAEGTTIRVKFRGVESWSELFDAKITHGTEVYWDFSWLPTGLTKLKSNRRKVNTARTNRPRARVHPPIP